MASGEDPVLLHRPHGRSRGLFRVREGRDARRLPGGMFDITYGNVLAVVILIAVLLALADTVGRSPR